MKKLNDQRVKKPRGFAAAALFAMMLSATLFLMSGCNPANKDTYVPQVVLQGQMYVGQAPEIRLIHTIPISDYYDADSVGISGADVMLTAGASTYRLAERLNDPRGTGYYGLQSPDTHTVAAGMNYSIQVVTGGDTITADTRAAGEIHITRPAHDADTLRVLFDDQFQFPIRWDQDPLARGYWLIYENINPFHADDSTFLCANNAGPDKRVGVYASYWNVPSRMDSTNSPPVLFNRDGLHRVRVVACDSALWNWSQTFAPGTVRQDPTTNVHGALGVFCAGGVDTTYFYILKNPAFNCP
jgi:hypothetical protein